MRIGIDLGGTKIEGIALGDGGETLWRQRVATPRNDYDGTVRAIAALVASIERDTGRQGSVGLGIPGTISPATGLVKNANSTWLNGKPFDVDLAHAMGRLVRIENDANCFALSEATDGAAAGASIVFAVIIGTGTGGGVSIDRHVVRGANAIGGEWGHNPLPAMRPDEAPGADCYCGRRGCIETFLSGPAVAREYAAAGGDPVAATEIAARAEGGEALAEACMARYEERMARALGTIMNVIDPHVIVFGGGLSNIERLYVNVPRLLPRYVFSDHVATRIVRAAFGDASGVRGAAWLW